MSYPPPYRSKACIYTCDKPRGLDQPQSTLGYVFELRAVRKIELLPDATFPTPIPELPFTEFPTIVRSHVMHRAIRTKVSQKLLETFSSCCIGLLA